MSEVVQRSDRRELAEALARQVAETRARLHEMHPGGWAAAEEFVRSVLENLAEGLALLGTDDAPATELAGAGRPALLETRRERSLFDFAPDAYLITNAAGLIREANHAACHLFQLGADWVEGRPLQARVAAEDQPGFEVLLDRVLREGRVEDFELRLIGPGERVVPVSVAVAEVPAEPGGRNALLWMIRDIGERKEAEENARHLAREQAARLEAEAARERITNILESISDAFVALDHEARITYVNRRAEQLLMRPRSEMLGRVGWEIFPELRGTAFEHEYHRVRREGLPVSFEEFYRPARLWIELHAFPSPDGLTIYFRNITSRRQAEARQRFLADVTARLVASIDYETTLDTVASTAVPHLADSCILYIADEAGALHRVRCVHRDPESEALLKEVMRQLPRGPHPPDSPFAQVLETGAAKLIRAVPDHFFAPPAPSEEQMAAIRRVAPASLLLLPLTSRGRTFGVLSLGRATAGTTFDETELEVGKELATRAALAVDNARLYAQAREAARLRQEVLHVVSHDLRNSLNATMLHLELLTLGLTEDDGEPRGAQQLEAIRRSSQHMHRLVLDLMDAENIELGRLSLRRSRCHALALIDEALDSIGPLAESRPLDLAVEAPPEEAAVEADHERVLQVLTNVLSNAIKFTPPGGRVWVGAAPEADAPMVRFWVRDTGPGIAAENLFRVFERHWQGKNASGRGAGLGLTIARGIVEAHGGCMWAESRAGEGSTFFFTLPTSGERSE